MGVEVTPVEDKAERLERALTEVAIETWRLSRLLERVVERLDAGEQVRYVGQLRYFTKTVAERLAEVDLKVVSLEGQPFDEGTAASALNIGDFHPDDRLVVDQMLEPIVMGADGLKRQGTVRLRKVVP
jgi:hypothetical protein